LIISGNVGIGTTSPQAKLHIEGNCVTGDTLLPIRRRKKRKKNPNLEGDGNGEPEGHGQIEQFEYEYLLSRIDEVLPGDEALSLALGGQGDLLSEDKSNIGPEVQQVDYGVNSGTLEYARINKLMDMGVQEVYELTTKSGRKIRTTANHPYLVQIN